MSLNVLDPSALVSSLPTLLPPTSKSLTYSNDGLAALIHTVFSALAFRLVSVDDSPQPMSIVSNVLPAGWDKNGPGHYTLKYRHDQSSLQFVINISKLGNRTLINAIAVESNKICSLDFATDDFVSPSFYPHDCNMGNGEPLIHGFISSSRVSDLVSQIKLKIIQNLIPGLQKEGYTEVPREMPTASQPSSSHDPTPAFPRPEGPFDPPSRSMYEPPSVYPRNPLEIGRRDLDPFPINPFTPPSLFPGSSGDGMFVGPNHPIFGGNRVGFPDHGPWGGDGYLPPMGAPPGARFDPVGPSFLPDRSGLGPLGRGSGGNFPRNMPGPDNDEFMPPGAGDMYM